ncbi:MAG: hypothetical protein AB1478_01775 [Nitrospirota bacterium]
MPPEVVLGIAIATLIVQLIISVKDNKNVDNVLQLQQAQQIEETND